MGVDSRVSNVGLRAFGAKAVTDVLNLCAKLISLIWFILKLNFYDFRYFFLIWVIFDYGSFLILGHFRIWSFLNLVIFDFFLNFESFLILGYFCIWVIFEFGLNLGNFYQFGYFFHLGHFSMLLFFKFC